MINGILLFIIPTLTIIWSLILIPIKIFRVHLFKITNPQKTILAMKHLGGISSILIDDKPRGWICGIKYIGYIHEVVSSGQHGSTTNSEIYILTTKHFHDILTKVNHENGTNIKQEKINIYERMGNYFHFSYDTREFNVAHYLPKKRQTKIIDTIISHYNEITNVIKCTVAIIYGPPGCGKSMVPLLIAKQLKASLCDTFNPTDPGDNLPLVYNAICPTPENPLVLVLEEYDITIEKIHHGKILPHKFVPTQVKNKTEVNQFFDKINRGFYPNMIIIMTSNKLPSYIDEMDVSYIRKGRVDLKIQLKN